MPLPSQPSSAASAPKRVEVTRDLRDCRFEPEEPIVIFRDAALERVDFSGIDFAVFVAQECTFLDCDFSSAKFRYGSMGGVPRSTYERCRFSKALLAADPDHARFVACAFEDVRIRNWFAFCTEFVDCTFSGSIRASKFSGKPTGVGAGEARRRSNDFYGNDFQRAELEGVAFIEGIDVTKQRWPDGYIVLDRIQERAKNARREVRKWEDRGAREDARGALELLTDEKQTGLVISRAELAEYFGARANDVLELLERAL